MANFGFFSYKIDDVFCILNVNKFGEIIITNQRKLENGVLLKLKYVAYKLTDNKCNLMNEGFGILKYICAN